MKGGAFCAGARLPSPVGLMERFSSSAVLYGRSHVQPLHDSFSTTKVEGRSSPPTGGMGYMSGYSEHSRELGRSGFFGLSTHFSIPCVMVESWNSASLMTKV